MYLILGEPRSERTMMKIWKNEVLTSKVVYKVGSIVGTKFNSILGAAQHANPKNLAVLMKYTRPLELMKKVSLPQILECSS